MSDDHYKAPKFSLDNYLKVKRGTYAGIVGRVLEIESFDNGLAPLYTLKDIGKQFESNLEFYM